MTKIPMDRFDHLGMIFDILKYHFNPRLPWQRHKYIRECLRYYTHIKIPFNLQLLETAQSCQAHRCSPSAPDIY